MDYPINEHFHSLQGEATFTGTPAFFIRFQGCDLRCEFCDTKYAWSFNSKAEDICKPPEKVENTLWENLSDNDLVVLAASARHIVITGGEPCLFDLNPLTRRFINTDPGITVQVETSGTSLPRIHEKTWLTVSPKFGNPGGKALLEEAIERANEFKFPIHNWEDVAKVEDFQKEYKTGKPIWLQPISQREDAVKVCYEAAVHYDWLVSAQVHKYLNLR